jgi:hypothetical protein
MTDTTENKTPAKVYEILGINPVTLAATAIQHWLKPLDENIAIENMAVELESTLMFEGITDLRDPAVMMCTQMRLLDTVFNQFVFQGMEYGPYRDANLQKISMALKAQRQCMQAYGALNRRRKPSCKNNDE